MALLAVAVRTASLLGLAAASEDFWWGTATAAPQIEGFPEADGRQPSIWDEGSKPEHHHIRDGTDMRFADMDYVYFENKTLPLLVQSGSRYYRMSISWTRVLRDQTLENPAGVEIPAGIAHYTRVLQLLKANGIEPVVTMFHWDTPLTLESLYGGFLNTTVMPPLFGEYAKVLLKHFGEYVRYWVSLNEPLTVITCAYSGGGGKAPFRCSNRETCTAGDDSTEPYIVAKTQILMHAHAFRAFRQHEESIGRTGGDMAMALNVGAYCVPRDASLEADVAAANRCMEWQVGLFFDPIFFGEYPKSMQTGVGSRLPQFSEEEKTLVKGSHSGLYFMNYYSSTYAWDAPDAREVCESGKPGCGWGSADGGFLLSFEKDGEYIGEKCKANEWLYSYPSGFRGYLRWVSDRYRDGEAKLRIVVTENGWGDPDTFSKEELVNDVDRCTYYRGHLEAMSLARGEDGVDLRGYFAWSLMDNFEWEDGYSTRFGLTYVDYKTQTRVPKKSFWWFQKNVFPLQQLPESGEFPSCDMSAASMLRGSADMQTIYY